jgi:hypothetical protein
MLPTIVAISIACAALAVTLLLRVRSYRGKRVVVCPETHETAGAEIDALAAARGEVFGEPQFVLSACSRWPENAACDQACAPQIADAPRETLVRDIVRRWYLGRSCSFCGASVEGAGDAVAPGLRTLDGKLHEWRDILPQDLMRVLDNAAAVCARCELTESFRRDFPAMVVERTSARRPELPSPPLRSSAVY